MKDEMYYKGMLGQYSRRIKAANARSALLATLVSDLLVKLDAARGAEHPDGMPAVFDEDYYAFVARSRALEVNA